MKSKASEPSRESTPKLNLHLIRLPARILELHDELVYRSKQVIVGRSQVTSTHSVTYDGEVVLTAGFPIVYFELMGKWFNVVKVRDLQGRHTGYYCDIATPPQLLKDGTVELTDLFLDLWVSPNLRYKVLDEEEFESALRRGWITKQLYTRAKKELGKLVDAVERGRFPPYHVKYLEAKLNL
jgi:predicted RNA-binding protein associated with RNAse of E/G family